MKLTATHLKRYKEIAGLFWKYGRSDLVKQMGMDEEDAKHAGESEDGGTKKNNGAVTPDQLADDLEAMGPTYVKLGQVLAGRPGPDAGRRDGGRRSAPAGCRSGR